VAGRMNKARGEAESVGRQPLAATDSRSAPDVRTTDRNPDAQRAPGSAWGCRPTWALMNSSRGVTHMTLALRALAWPAHRLSQRATGRSAVPAGARGLKIASRGCRRRAARRQSAWGCRPTGEALSGRFPGLSSCTRPRRPPGRRKTTTASRRSRDVGVPRRVPGSLLAGRMNKTGGEAEPVGRQPLAATDSRSTPDVRGNQDRNPGALRAPGSAWGCRPTVDDDMGCRPTGSVGQSAACPTAASRFAPVVAESFLIRRLSVKRPSPRGSMGLHDSRPPPPAAHGFPRRKRSRASESRPGSRDRRRW
jgi:hypothetical protein